MQKDPSPAGAGTGRPKTGSFRPRRRRRHWESQPCTQGEKQLFIRSKLGWCWTLEAEIGKACIPAAPCTQKAPKPNGARRANRTQPHKCADVSSPKTAQLSSLKSETTSSARISQPAYNKLPLSLVPIHPHLARLRHSCTWPPLPSRIITPPLQALPATSVHGSCRQARAAGQSERLHIQICPCKAVAPVVFPFNHPPTPPPPHALPLTHFHQCPVFLCVSAPCAPLSASPVSASAALIGSLPSSPSSRCAVEDAGVVGGVRSAREGWRRRAEHGLGQALQCLSLFPNH